MKLKLDDYTEKDIWLAAFASRAALVVQQQSLHFSAEQCATFADSAVYEYRKRIP